ncbi:hypothetical protein DFP94_102217 [Fontibacillus phaseoli]|uniref:Uncharacterized protein n=1 Tax=Fontibacillus phaseoli TaxID=1416533 RepID=A0A369BP68_9BACL|nr:hypothetical protein [Fontibacillus phaseoli]RCX21464.1 hypothetical protein DFP94_102217 [Fontibacillus phaseoli]
MDKQSKQTTDPAPKTNEKLNSTPHTGKMDAEFAEELTSSDIKSAFKNPVTGEERLY